jgi:creatinine amidohydrolase
MTGPIRPYRLREVTWAQVRDTGYEVAVLPWGATEAHNLHLPYGTDVYEAEHVAEAAGGAAWERGARVLVLPAIPYGVQTGQLDIPWCMNLNPSTQAAMLRDVAESVERAGARKLVLLNGHGGNEFRAMIRELQPRVGLFLCVVDWYRVGRPETFFERPGDHGGELETSVMMHLEPDLVRPLTAAGDGAERRFRLAALREGWAWAPRHWTRISDDTGVGDPRAATAAKGAAYFSEVTARIADFLVELAALEPEELYEANPLSS